MKRVDAPLVSIVAPCFNVSSFVSETLVSVQTQSWTDWELLVIDDGSTDETADIVSDFVAKDGRMRLLRQQENLGPSAARNYGINLAKGAFLAFIDSDDLWSEKKLDKQICFMRDNDCALSYTAYRKINWCGSPISKTIMPRAHVTYESLLRNCSIAFQTAMLDLRKTGKIYFRPEISLGEDHVFWLDVLSRIRQGILLDECLCSVRVRKGSLSYNKFRKAAGQWRVYRDTLGLALPKALWYFTHYAVHGLLKYRV